MVLESGTACGYHQGQCAHSYGGGKFAKVSHPGLVCAHRVVGWAGQMAGESNLGQASCAGTGKKGSLN